MVRLSTDAELRPKPGQRGSRITFSDKRRGLWNLHYRDYEEPPGNGGFLLNGGRLYLDMGHIEYASPECVRLRDTDVYDLAGDAWLLTRCAKCTRAITFFFHQE